MPQTETLSEKQNCRSVSFFSLLLTGLNLKYKLRFNILLKGKKVQNFRLALSHFYDKKKRKSKN